MYGATFRFGNKKDGVAKINKFLTPPFFFFFGGGVGFFLEKGPFSPRDFGQ